MRIPITAPKTGLASQWRKSKDCATWGWSYGGPGALFCTGVVRRSAAAETDRSVTLAAWALVAGFVHTK